MLNGIMTGITVLVFDDDIKQPMIPQEQLLL
jgi:hypothetical protein